MLMRIEYWPARSPFRLSARQHAQVGEAGGGVENVEPLPALPVEALELADERAAGEGFGPLVFEAQDHDRRDA
jgi:hypothetical protein